MALINQITHLTHLEPFTTQFLWRCAPTPEDADLKLISSENGRGLMTDSRQLLG